MAEQVAATVGNVFVVVRSTSPVPAGGSPPRSRLRRRGAIPVLRLVRGVIETVGAARDLDEAAEVMGYVRAVVGHRAARRRGRRRRRRPRRWATPWRRC